MFECSFMNYVVVGSNPVAITLVLFLLLALVPNIVCRKIAAAYFQYLVRYKQGCHQSGKPGKVRELKICLRNQEKLREFIKKMVKSWRCQEI